MNIEEIQQKMEQGQLTPTQMAEMRSVLAGKYARARDIWDGLETQRFEFLNHKDWGEVSEAARNREWNGTFASGKWRKWKSQMRKIDRMMNALSSQIRVAEGEERGTI